MNPDYKPKWLISLQDMLRKKIQRHPQLFQAIHNSGWLFADKLVRALLGLFIGAWLARYLGPSLFGELTYYLAFIAIFQAIVNLGLDQIVVREIANHPIRANVVLGSVLVMRLLVGIICWLSALMAFHIINPEQEWGLLIVSLIGLSLVFQAVDTIDLWFQGNSQSRRTVWAKSSSFLIINCLKVILIIANAPFLAFVVTLALEGLLTTLALIIAYHKFPCAVRWRCNFYVAKKLIHESWPYLISGLCVAIYMRIDQIMIKNILDESRLGIYSAVITISGAWNMIPMVICMSMAPIFARQKLINQHSFDYALVNLFRLLWAIACLTIFFVLIFSEILILKIFGPPYLESFTLLNIYVLTAIPIFLGVAQGIWLVNHGKAKIILYQTVIGAFTAVICNALLLPSIGLHGAAVSAVISQTISAVGINFIIARDLFRMQMGIRPRKNA